MCKTFVLNCTSHLIKIRLMYFPLRDQGPFSRPLATSGTIQASQLN